MTPKEKSRLRLLTNKLKAITGFTEQMCKVALWIEYQEGGMPYAERYVEMAVSNSLLNKLGSELVESGHDPDVVLEMLHAARVSGGDANMKKVAKGMMGC